MKYRRINKDTVQCIVTGEDLEEYGLQLSDIFERNERGEGFLRDLIQEAHEEVGYNCTGNNIAMQISPFKDNGMIITFCEESESTFKDLLNHMKEAFEAAGLDNLDDLHDIGMHCETHAESKESAGRISEQYGETRVFEFESIGDVCDFAHEVINPSQVRSCLVKSDGKFYLITMKNRMSWKNYNKLSANAFDFAKIIAQADDKLIYLGEHGEMIIENGALNRLSKI